MCRLSHPLKRFFLAPGWLLPLFALGILAPRGTGFDTNAHAQWPQTSTIFGEAPKPVLVHDGFQLADGAAWDGAGRLFVPDVKAETVLLFNLSRPNSEPHALLKRVAASGTCYQQGALYFANHPGCRVAKVANGKVTLIAKWPPVERPNDLVVHADGTIFVTFTRQGFVRRIQSDGTDSKIVTGIESPNGIALSPDGRTLYISSAKSGAVYRFPQDVLNSKEPVDLADLDSKEILLGQLPETPDGFRGDGMCCDRAGNVYVTGADSVFVFSPKGEPMGRLKMSTRPINVVLGGRDGRQLFISTFDGLYRIAIHEYGVSPNPLTSGGERQGPASTTIPDNIDATLNVPYYETPAGRKLLMDVFSPTVNSDPKPAIVVVHGGGWIKGDKTKFRALALRLAERGYVTAAIEYRLGFESKFPAAIHDCNSAIASLRQNADTYGIDPDRIGAVGGSAGGHLVGLAAAGGTTKELWPPQSQPDERGLKAIAVLAGPLQIATGPVAEKADTARGNSNAVIWFGGSPSEVPELYELADAYNKISKSMPPTLFISGSLDRPERNQPARDKMDQLGVVNELVIHPDARHGHWNHPDWIEQVVDDLDHFFQRQL